MTQRALQGYHALRAEAFARLGPDLAERLVRQLLDREATERHAPGYELRGPPPPYRKGADLRLTLQSPARASAGEFQTRRGAAPLTFDEVGVPVVYSVKWGEHWRTDALDEAKERSDWALDALEKGGRLVVVTMRIHVQTPTKGKNRPTTKAGAKKKAAKKQAASKPSPSAAGDLLDALAASYAARIPGAGADLRERIHLVDANTLESYVSSTGYVLDSELRGKLGIPEVPRMIDLISWEKRHRIDRPPAPSFIWDPTREGVRKAILDCVQSAPTDASARALWLIAPPGVGKTRLVVECLRPDEKLTSRVFIATSGEDALDALRDHGLLRTYKDAIVVVDDCPVDRVESLFLALAPGDERARLLLITPIAEEGVTALARQVPRIRLEPMDEASSTQLIAGELGMDQADPRVTTLVELTKGYPWFACLVAREMKQPGVPPPRRIEDAVDLALCARPCADFQTEVDEIGKALFVVMLLEGLHLDDVQEADRGELIHALEIESWHRLRAAIKRSGLRGLLRAGAGGVYRYVTPAIVEREIAKRFLMPPSGPMGPKPFRSRITSAFLKRKLSELLTRLEALGVAENHLAELATPILDDLVGQTGLAPLARVSNTELLFAARHQPLRTASILRRVVESTPRETLRADRKYRRSLMFALEWAASRRGTFADVEEALFRLATEENESFGNNATAVWQSLFDVGLNTTYLSFEERLETLSSRTRSDVPRDRAAALGALSRLTSGMPTTKTAFPELDGPHLRPSPEEATRARVSGWKLLIERLDDENAQVRTRAVEVVAKGLRSLIRSGLLPAVAEELLAGLSSLSELELMPVREAVDRAMAYDGRFINDAVDAATRAMPADGRSVHDAADADVWERIRTTIAPTSYRARLRQRVGAWDPVALRNQPAMDEALAREGFAPPAPLLDEIEWLMSHRAGTVTWTRALSFAVELGAVDEAEQARPLIMRRFRDGPLFCAAYMAGRDRAGAHDSVNRAIADLRASDAADAALYTMWRVGYSPERARWLTQDIANRAVSDTALDFLSVGGWTVTAPDPELFRLVETLLARASDTAARAALDLVHARTEGDPSPMADERRALLLRAFERASRLDLSSAGFFSYVWQQAALRLLAEGLTTEVARGAAIVGAGSEFPTHELSVVLGACVKADAGRTWSALEETLNQRDDTMYSLSVALREAGVVDQLPADLVDAWVQRDPRRGMEAVQLVAREGHALPELARRLLKKFGPESEVADSLLAELETTPGAVQSLAVFAAEQLDRVQGWLKDPEPSVRRFAQRAAEALKADRDRYAAREDYERRRRLGA